MGFFNKRTNPPQASAPRLSSFDGVAGADRLGGLATAFLQACADEQFEAALQAAQDVMQAVPGDPRAPAREDFFEAPWKWAVAVAKSSAGEEGQRGRAAKIGLMTQVWTRQVLKSESRYQMGRLVPPPPDLEVAIYASSVSALVGLSPTSTLVSGRALSWTVGEAIEQISSAVDTLRAEGTRIDPELERLLSGDPSAFDNARGVSSSSPADPFDSTHARLKAEIDSAKAGDDASQMYVDAGALIMSGRGDDPRVFELLQEAARLGHVGAMYDAGGEANRKGDPATAAFWWEAAATARRADAAWNLAATAYDMGRLDDARDWYGRVIELGDNNGYAALTQMAADADEEAAEFKWARQGAAAGHPFCQKRLGLLTLNSETGGDQAIRDALPHLESVAQAGDSEAMMLAGLAHVRLGNRLEARQWLHRAESAGEERARHVLEAEGL